MAWADDLPGIEVVPVVPPGRGNRLRERPFDRMAPAVTALADAVEPLLDRPWAVLGHSMGALIAFELAREIERRGRPRPERLLLSGRRAPGTAPPSAPIHDLPDDRFLDELRRRYDGIPGEVLDHPELLALFLPLLRADFALVETYEHRPEPRVSVPFSVWTGEDDPQAPPDELGGWGALTDGDVRVRVFPGGHFYLYERRAGVTAALREELVAVVRAEAIG